MKAWVLKFTQGSRSSILQKKSVLNELIDISSVSDITIWQQKESTGSWLLRSQYTEG